MKEYDKKYENLLTDETREIGYYIIEFYKVLLKIGNEKYINNFLENIKTLRVRKVNNSKKTGFITAGQYYSHTNILEYNEKYMDIIFHELFHLASTDLKKGKIGFKKVINRKCYGSGINEGYTTLLTSRYFPFDETSYIFLPEIMEVLENVLGEEKMLDLYFCEDPDKLYDELEIYLSKEEVNELIDNLDYLLKKLLNDINIPNVRKKIYEKAKKASDLIFKYIIKKTEDEYEKKLITLEDAEMIINSLYDMGYNYIFKKEIIGLYMYKLYDYKSLTSLINETATKFKLEEEYVDDDYYFYKKKNGVHRVKKKEIKYIDS